MSSPTDARSRPPDLPSAAVLVLVAAVTAGVAATWAAPPLAMLLVWPWLFALPGWILVRRVAPDLPRAGISGVGVITSIYVASHLVDLVSRVDGFGRVAILVTAALLLLATVVVARVQHPWLEPWDPPALRDVPRSIASAMRAEAPAWLLAGAVTLVVGGVLFANAWRETPEGFVSGGWNWSDFLVHVAIGNSIVHGNYPPEVPYVAGEPLSYHWFADFHGAILATVADVPIIPVFLLSSALLAGVLALVVWALAVVLTADRRVASIATVLVCAGGGMGWLRLVGDALGGTALGGEAFAGGPSIVDLVMFTPYDNSWADDWPFFRIASIFGTGFLPHRATTFGLPGLVAVVLLVAACLGRRPAGLALAGLLAALLAPFHFYAFPATYLIVGLYLAWALGSGRWRPGLPGFLRDAALLAGPAVLALGYVLPAATRQSEEGAFRFILGWGEARLSEGPAGVLFFYATNLGIPVLLALVALVALRGRRAVPAWGFLGAWLVCLFLVPNLVVVSAVEFDMNKYFQIMWIAVAILAAWLLARWPRPIVVAVLAVCAISPALIAVHHATHPAVTMSLPQAAAGRWIEANTPERAVFATDDFINSPVDLGGRLRITTFGPYVANLGYDPEPRAAAIDAIYCDGPDVAAERMTTFGATYVLSSGGILECADGLPTDFGASPRFETVYDVEGVSIWRLAEG